MTMYELRCETEPFQLGYWHGFEGRDMPNIAPFEWPSQRLEYYRGFEVGRIDFKTGR